MAADQWSRSAEGWGKRATDIQGWAMPVSQWMLDSLELQPGETVVELAAGPGETGLLAAELVRPGGRVLISDFAEEMLDVARARAAGLGDDKVELPRAAASSLDTRAG